MSRVVVGVLVFACGCLISPVMHFGGGKMGAEGQRETLEKVTPQGLVIEKTWTKPITTAKIRVYADDQYRAQNTHWETVFGDELDYANRILAAEFGVHLEAEYRTWSRNAPGATLSETLRAVEGLDAGGEDVVSVIALTSSLGLVTATFEELGLANLGGQHIALRGHADVDERKLFDAAFPDLRAEERELYFASQRRHKTTTTLLHELAHNLGADHADESETIMSPSYSPKAGKFDQRTHEILMAAFDSRVRHDTGKDPVVAATPAVATPGASTLPSPASWTPGSAATNAPIVPVALEPSGAVRIGGMFVNDKDLADLFAMHFKNDPNTRVEIHASHNVPGAAVSRVKKLALDAGLTDVVTAP